MWEGHIFVVPDDMKGAGGVMRTWAKLICSGLLISFCCLPSVGYSNMWDNAEILSEDLIWPSNFVLKEGYLYWGENSDSPIRRVPLSGGPVTTLARKVVAPENMVLHEDNIYWMETRHGGAPSGCLGEVPLLNKTSMDGATTVLATSNGCEGEPFDLVISGKYIYWYNSTTTPHAYYIVKVPTEGPAGGTPETIFSAAAPVKALAGDGTYLYWIEQGAGDPGVIKKGPAGGGDISVLYESDMLLTRHLATEGDNVIFVQERPFVNYRIAKISKGGGVAITLAEPSKRPVKLLATGGNVYWIDDQAVCSVSTDAGSTKVLASVSGLPFALTVDSESVFWSEGSTDVGSDRRIRSVSSNGGNVQTVVQEIHDPVALVSDGTHLYWVEGGPYARDLGFGRIAKVPVDGGLTTTVLSGIAQNFPKFTIIDDMIYVADIPYVKKLPITGGNPERLVFCKDGVWDVTSEGRSLYWIQGEGGRRTRDDPQAGNGGRR